jgi:DNA-binding XRE family transcriptional regulator
MTRKSSAKATGRVKIRIWLAGIRDRGLARRLRAAAPDLELVGAPRGAPPDLVMLARADYQQLLDEVEDKQAAEAHARTASEERVPLGVVCRLIADENPIRVWREHRGMTLDELGAAAGLSKGYLSDLERGNRAGPVETLQAVARALRVTLDDLVPRDKHPSP